MCYKCNVCNAVVGQGEPRRVYHVIRQVPSGDTFRNEIAAELPVCKVCHVSLTVLGIPLETLRKKFRVKKVAPLPPVLVRDQNGTSERLKVLPVFMSPNLLPPKRRK